MLQKIGFTWLCGLGKVVDVFQTRPRPVWDWQIFEKGSKKPFPKNAYGLSMGPGSDPTPSLRVRGRPVTKTLSVVTEPGFKAVASIPVPDRSCHVSETLLPSLSEQPLEPCH